MAPTPHITPKMMLASTGISQLMYRSRVVALSSEQAGYPAMLHQHWFEGLRLEKRRWLASHMSEEACASLYPAIVGDIASDRGSPGKWPKLG